MSPAPDYRLDGYAPATDTVADAFFSATINDDTSVSLAEHHTDDGHDSYLVLCDGSAIWGILGVPAYLALHIARDTEQRAFRFASEPHPLASLAQQWLIARNCPADAIGLAHDKQGPRPADDLTTRLEEQLRTAGSRYKVLDHYTHNFGTSAFGVETWVLARDHHPRSAALPYRLFIETADKGFTTYTMREGVFPSADAAHDWLDNRDDGPSLPRPGHGEQLRVQAAHGRSTATSASGRPSSPFTPPLPSGQQSPSPRRSQR